MTLKEKRIEWKGHYDAWKESGQTVAAWCREHGIAEHQMYYWVQRFDRDDGSTSTPSKTQWVSVEVDENPFPSSGQGPILLHVESISVEVRPGADMNLLFDIVQVLRSQC